MEKTVTSDLADFGGRERKMAEELLRAWREQGLPEYFDDNGVTVNMNMNSGYVFLSNSDYQVAMMNGDKLESFYSCFECGNEGFADEIDWSVEQGLCGDCKTEEEEEGEEV